ncbi:MAG: ECF-type sigma factor [bacterium]|nr:ECF-type sigma factor [bacterium]
MLQSLASGERLDTSDELLMLVYDELRDVARGMIKNERPGHTLQPTALVHEAYLRVAGGDDPQWQGRRHFFAAATEAMRRILIEQARRKSRKKRGGDVVRVQLDFEVAMEEPNDDVVRVDEVLQKLEAAKPHLRELVNLRYFGEFSLAETAELLGRSESTVTREWRFVRAWLKQELAD